MPFIKRFAILSGFFSYIIQMYSTCISGNINKQHEYVQSLCIFFPYTVLPRFITPLYNAKCAYRHNFLTSRFIYVIMSTSHIAIRQTIFSAKVSKLIYFPSLIMPNCLITFIKIHNWMLSELNQYTSLVMVLGFYVFILSLWESEKESS